LRVEHNDAWRASVSAPQGTAFAMRIVWRTPDKPAVSSWHFLDTDGQLIADGPERETTYDPRRRPWFRAAVNANGPASVGPYVSASTDALTLSIAMPMAEDKRAVIGADVTLETISRMLAENPVSEHSVGYVFDENGKLIVHSNPAAMAELVGGLSAGPSRGTALAVNDPAVATNMAVDVVARGSDTPGVSLVENDPVLAAVEGLLATSSEQADPVEFRVGNEPWLARISSIGFSDLLTGHRIVIAAPITDFTEASAALLRKTLSIASTLVLAGILVALLISRRISRALTALTADANRIGDLDFQSRPLTHSWISEINTLARALSAARDAIKTFAVYVPRELVRKIVASGQDEAGAAVRREVTVLFTDIRDFTTISEQHSPEAVVDMLSAYFQTMNVVVQRHNGVIVQYLGDSIYAMWNAPAENPHHVEDGCRCTLALKAAIDAFNAANAEAGRPELITRYGLHTGIAVVGSVGAAERRQYTAMGDMVNVASRLEGMNKQFGTTILASAAIRQRAENLADVAFRPLGAASAKGRNEQIEVFEMIG
jgi:adenylate cyclase